MNITQFDIVPNYHEYQFPNEELMAGNSWLKFEALDVVRSPHKLAVLLASVPC
jgi:hypothetical protein